jgi:hypothetical protein
MKRTLIAAVLALATGSAAAGAIQNADFSAGLSSWQVANDVTADAGVATLTPGWAGVYASLSQQITLGAGEIFTGTARFVAKDYMAYNDHAMVKMNDQVLFYADIAAVGDYGSTGPATFQFIAASAGQYTFWAGVANAIDETNPSQLFISDLAIGSGVPVPEPAPLALIGLSLAAAALVRRKTV